VRVHFQRRPWDLCLCITYTVVLAGGVLATGTGDLLAILVVVFVPGYVIVAALFPRRSSPEKPGIDWVERIALSFGLSIAVIPLLGLLINFTPWGTRFSPIVATIAFFTVGVGFVAYWRRMRVPPDQRLAGGIELAMPAWKEYGLVDRILTIALAASIVVTSGTLTYFVLAPRAGGTFTEFYILGPGGEASGYPTTLNTSEAGTVIVGIANHESMEVNYTVRVDLVGLQISYNATSGLNETIETNRSIRSTFNVSLMDGVTWTHRYPFSILTAGLWKLQFLLFRNNDFSPYRNLYLFVRVM